jgi:uncharacterized CHY-type Zn-finger protein
MPRARRAVMPEKRPIVRGIDVDEQSRCKHYHSALDIVAIKMKCCGAFYACKDCHNELAGHAIEPWPPEEWEEKAILCGACGQQVTINEYLKSGDDCGNARVNAQGNRCPMCAADFNPGCRNHHHFYFDM